MQLAVYNSLIKAQTDYPQLTAAQYALFQKMYKEIQKNKPVMEYHG